MLAPTVLLSLLLACNSDAPSSTPPGPVYTDADRIGTTPDFYEQVPKNLLMISIDTFRKDHLARYGGGDLTPFLDGLAESGFTLDDHTQCSNWTYASTVCTLQGAYNEERGFLPKLSTKHSLPVPQGTPFLSTWLGEAGFYSILVSGNSWLGPIWGSSQGYDEATNPNVGRADLLYEEGLVRLLDAQAAGRADRWFLHLHLMEPHAPYVPPDEYLTELAALPPIPYDVTIKDEHYEATADYSGSSEAERELLEQHLRVRYEGELGYLDDQLQTILLDLASRGLLDDTLVVIWNDHGEQFWEHGYQSHAYTLHTEENDAWALFWAKNIVPGRHAGPTSAIDLVPTLLSLWDQPMPPEVTGHPVGTAPADRPRFATSIARLGAVQMVRQERHKLTYSWSGLAKFFDTEADPLEQVDLFSSTDPEVQAQVQALWSLLEPYAELTEPLAPEHTRFDPPGL